MTNTNHLPVIVTQFGKVQRLTLNRPNSRNALSLELLEALTQALSAAQSHDGTNVIVLAAMGSAFSAGHDLKELTAARQNSDGGIDIFERTFRDCAELMIAVAQSPKPIIAEVQGIATAAGCQLVASCDLVVASETAHFATPGVNIGLFCSTPAVALTRAVSPKAAMEMLLTGDAIDAMEARRIGLINRISAPDLLTEETMALAAHIAAKPAAVIALGRRSVCAQQNCDLPDAYALAGATMIANMGLPEAQDGIARFLNARHQKPTPT
jgi:enoyl-CoA hydratase/carnithine racemase